MEICKKCGNKTSGKDFCNGVCALTYRVEKVRQNINYTKRDVSGDFRW